MAVSLDLQTGVCCVCRGTFHNDRVESSGHFRATDCYGAYLAVGAAWHEGCGGAPLGQEPDAEMGCYGPWEEWMGVVLRHSYASPFDPKRRA